MACTVESVILSNGEVSELFQHLADNMSQAAALETYLELSNSGGYVKIYGRNKQGEVDYKAYATTPKFKLAEFDTYRQQTDLMEYLSDIVIDGLSAQANHKSKTTLSPINLEGLTNDPLVLRGIITNVRARLTAKKAANLVSSDQMKLVDMAIEELPRYLGESGALGPLGLKLKDYGINIKVSDTFIDTEKTYEERVDEDGQVGEDGNGDGRGTERLFNMSIMDINPATTILAPLKLFIKRLPRVHKTFVVDPSNPYAEPAYEYGEAGAPRPLNYGMVYGKLQGLLRGVQSVAQMEQILRESLISSPELIPLYRKLIAEKEAPTHIPKVSAQYHKLSTALMSLAKADYNMVSFVDYGKGDVRVNYANSTTIQHKIREAWSLDIQATKELGRDIKESRKLAIKSFVDSNANDLALNKLVSDKLNKNVKVPAPNGITLDRAAKIFRANGFLDVTKEDLQVAITNVKNNPYLLNEKGNEVTASAIIGSLLTTLPLRVLEGKDVFNTSEDGEFAENKTLGILSKAVAERKSDIFAGSFLSGRGTVVSPINLSSEAHDTLQRLQRNPELVAKYLEDPIYENSILFDILGGDSNAKGMFELQTMDVFKTNSINKGVTYGKLSSFDALALKMNSFFAPRQNSQFYHAFSPTLGDRGTLIMLVVPKLNVEQNKEAYTQSVRNAKGEIVSEQILKWVYDQTKAEVTRMARARSITNYENYSKKDGREFTGNAHKFNLFPALNSIELGIVQNNAESIRTAVQKVLPQAQKEFVKMLDSDGKYIVSKGLLASRGKDFTTTLRAKNVLNSKIGVSDAQNKRSKLKVIQQKDMDTFLANNFIYSYEQTTLFVGDMAFYKEGSPSVQMVDMNKRFALPLTPGVKTPTSENTGMPATSKVIILKEGKQEATFMGAYNQILGKKQSTKNNGKRTYTDIELADGIGYISLDRYRRMMTARGMHTDGMLKLLDDLEKWTPNSKKIITESNIAAVKNFYFKLKQTPEGIMAPFGMKYALFPAIPAFFEQEVNGEQRFPTMAKISKALREGVADEIVMESAVKVGRRNVTDVDTLEFAEPIEIDNDAVRIPQITPTETKLSDRAGSQFRKQSIGDFAGTGDLSLEVSPDNTHKIDSETALNGYNNAITKIVTDAGINVTKTFIDEDGNPKTPTLIENLLNDVENNPHNNGEFYREALSTTFKDNPLLSLNHPSIAGRLDNLINATYRRKVNRFKMPGHSAVQIPSYGMSARKSNGSLEVVSDLNFIRFQTEKGRILTTLEAKTLGEMIRKNKPEDQEYIQKHKILPAEIRVSPKFFLGRLKQIAKENVEKDLDSIREKAKAYVKRFDGTKAEQTDRYKNFMKSAVQSATTTEYRRLKNSVSDAKGNVLVEKLATTGLDQIVLYRIPTQLKNTSLPAKIKEFLPEYSGNTIQVPSEIVEQAGSDFDIDKVYIEMKDFTVNEEGGFDPINFMDIEGNIDISTKAKAQAYIQEFHRAVLRSPSHVAELLLPNTTRTLYKIANEVYGKNDDSLIASWASAETQEHFRDANKSGKDLIAISSISSVMHVMAAHIGAKFTKGIKVAGKDITLGMSNNYILQKELEDGKLNPDSYGDKIAYEIFQIQNAALDNAKDPLLGKLNISDFTASAALFLVSTGHGLKFATDLLNTPIIKDLADNYSIYSRTMSETQALKQAVKDVKSFYGLRGTLNKSVYSLDSFTAEKAEALIEQTNPTEEDLMISLQAFIDIKDLGDQLSTFQRDMNFDSKGTPSSVVKLIEVQQTLAGIPGTLAHADYQNNPKTSILGEYSIIPEPSPIEVNAVMYNKSHLAAMERYSVQEPLNTNYIVSPTASLQFQRVLEVAKKSIGFLNESQQLQLIADYNTYLTTSADSNTISKTSVSSQVESGDFMKLSDNDTGVGAEILAYRREIENDPNAVSNLFIENLTVVKNGNRKFVTFNNTISATLTGELKEEMMFHFEDMMYSQNPRENRLARRLADYAITHYGFRKGINSFMDLLPPQAHVQYMGTYKGVNATSVPDHFRALEPMLNSKKDFKTPDSFVRDFVRNNFTGLTAVEYVDLKNQDWQYELFSETKQPNFVKGYFKGELRLYEKDGGSYKPLKAKGIPNLALEYHSNKDSFFNGGDATDMSGNKSNQTNDNKATEEVISDFNNYEEVFREVGDHTNMVFTPTSLSNYVVEVMNYIEKNSTFTKVEMTNMKANTLSSVVNSANTRFKLGKRHNPTMTFNKGAHDALAVTLKALNEQSSTQIEQIKNCNS